VAQNLKGFLIERHIPGVGAWDDATKQRVAQASNDVIAQLGQRGVPYEWVGSVATGPDTLVCYHRAPDEAAVRQHSTLGNFPIESVVEGDQLPDGSMRLGPRDAA
jgi:hypothetical protein